MTRGSETQDVARLLEAAYRQTLASFRDQVARGDLDPSAEIDTYRRRRRDYATSLRMDHVPAEARELAARLLETHGLRLDEAAQADFERDVSAMLVRLYDAFLEEAARDQGSR